MLSHNAYLYQTINNRNEDLALILVDHHRNNTEIMMAVYGDNDKSLLNLAIDLELKKLADHLLALQKDEDLIIFGEDTSKQSCFFLAAKKGYLDILKTITIISQTKDKKFWLKPDIDSNLALHASIESGKLETSHFLLDLMLAEKDAIDLINHRNKDGNTVLHLACSNPHFPIDLIARLIENGADYSLSNNINRTAYEIIFQRDIQDQKRLISELNKKQTEFLNYYHDQSREYRKDDKVKTNYRDLIAHRNESIFRTGMKSFKSKFKSGEDMDFDNIVIPDDLHYSKVDSFSEDTESFEKEWVVIDLGSKNKKSEGYAYELLDADLEEINALINTFQNHGNTFLSRNAKQFNYPRLFYVAAPLLTAVLTLELLLAYAKNINAESFNQATDWEKKNELREIGGLIAALMLFLPVAAIVLLGIAPIWFRPTQIDSWEWDELSGFIDAALLLRKLENLQEIEIEHKQSHPSESIEYLPTAANNIQQLKNLLHTFDAESMPLTDLNQTFTDLNNTLTTIRNDVQYSNKPYSRFFQPAEETRVSDVTDLQDYSDTDNNSSTMSDGEGGIKLFTIKPRGYGAI